VPHSRPPETWSLSRDLWISTRRRVFLGRAHVGEDTSLEDATDALGSGDDGDAYDSIQVCAVLNTCTLAPTIPPTL
jgi:hypothetical protein